jgi:ABC-type Na+ transport system ATPase subunit NatA
MNRLQAMAKIMAMLTEEENLQQGSREYKIARKLVSRKIDRLGPETALLQVVDRRHQLMEQIKMLMSLEDSRIKHPHLDF